MGEKKNSLSNPAIFGGFIRAQKGYPVRPGEVETMLDALATGDASGAIERSEAVGQATLVSRTLIPKDLQNITKEHLENLGFVLEDTDDIFYKASLPLGWELRPSDHAMWNYIYDDKGRTRFALFYKAAFYDRLAFMRAECRYVAGSEAINDVWERENGYNGTYVGYVKDAGQTIFQTDPTTPEPNYKGTPSKEWHDWYNSREIKHDEATAWAKAHYPDYFNPLAYWDE